MQFGTLPPERALHRGDNAVELFGVLAGGMELVRFERAQWSARGTERFRIDFRGARY
ncbi:MAG: hypothetical protein SF182_10205 [Deltaproteobacteria bacterium]|nr:hypothetical protein [Deltaproteobacteria bacterium]